MNGKCKKCFYYSGDNVLLPHCFHLNSTIVPGWNKYYEDKDCPEFVDKECKYNVLMMEEYQHIVSVGAGAVTKLVEYYPANIATTKIIIPSEIQSLAGLASSLTELAKEK